MDRGWGELMEMAYSCHNALLKQPGVVSVECAVRGGHLVFDVVRDTRPLLLPATETSRR